MRRSLILRALMICFLSLVSVVVTPAITPAQSTESGNVYRSGTYGFEIAWDDRTWYVIEQELEDGLESLTLADGSSFIFFTAGTDLGGDPQSCLADLVAELTTSPVIEDLTPLLDDDGDAVRGANDDRAFGAFTYTYRLSSGESINFARYIDCQTMIPDESTIISDVIAPVEEYEDELPLAREVIDGLALPSPGELGPVFAEGDWRFAVVAAERGEQIDAAGLAPRGDRDWLAIVLDVTNQSDERATLDLDDLTVRVEGDADPLGIAPGSTENAADTLGTQPTSTSQGVAVRAGQTRRVTLVYRLPVGAGEPTLHVSGTSLPLATVLQAEADLTDLGRLRRPPFLREARIDEVLDGGRLAVTFTSDETSAIVRLIGVEGRSAEDCYGEEYLAALFPLIGETVTVEREIGQTGGATIGGYVWLDDDGVAAQLNQRLLAAGDAALADDSANTRFGDWLAGSATTAQLAGLGLWGACSQ